MAIAVGVGGHLAALLLLGVRVAPPPTSGPAPAFVSLVSGARDAGNPVVSEQLEYMSPEPLFLPTAWNAGEHPLPEALRRQPDQAFQSFEPQMVFLPNRLAPVVQPPVAVAATPIRAMDLGALPTFSALGRQQLPPVSLDREAFVEVRRVGDGGIVHAGPLHGLPGIIREVSWAPIDFLIAINREGMLGSPSIEAGSGSTEIDELFRGFLDANYRLGERLQPGFYRVTVGP